MNLPVTQKHFLSFSRKLFLSVISLFLVFAVCFIAYQYQREREYKVELLGRLGSTPYVISISLFQRLLYFRTV